MKAMAILAVTATLVVVAAEAVEVAEAVLSAQALVNRRVARATAHWREENTAEALVVVACYSHATGSLRVDLADAHYLPQVDIRSTVVDSQSYYSYRFLAAPIIFISRCRSPLACDIYTTGRSLSIVKERSARIVFREKKSIASPSLLVSPLHTSG